MILGLVLIGVAMWFLFEWVGVLMYAGVGLVGLGLLGATNGQDG